MNKPDPSEQVRKCEPAYDDLVASLARGRVVVVVGAGASMSLGCPGWQDLVNHVHQRAVSMTGGTVEVQARLAAKHNDPLVAASQIEQVMGREFVLRTIAEILIQTPATEFPLHAALFRLGARLIATTNYDLLIEGAYQLLRGHPMQSVHMGDHERLFATVQSGRSGLEDKCLHIHGSLRQPELIVFTQEDYDKLYIANQTSTLFLDTLFSTSVILFVGFGLRDPDLLHMVRRSRVIAGATHFALIGVPSGENMEQERQEAATKWGIQAICYDAGDNHAALLARLQDLASAAEGHRVTELPDFVQSILIGVHSPAEAAGGLRTALQARYPGAGTWTIASTSCSADATDGHVDKEIDRIMTAVADKGRAIAALMAMLENNAATLSPRQVYRIHANAGNCHYQQGDIAAASSAYLRATGLWKETPDACVIEVIGHILAGNRTRAHELARKVCADAPAHARAHAMLVRSLPPATAYDEALAVVPSDLRRDAEVAFALAERAESSKRFDEQLEHARIAAASEGMADAREYLADALLRRVQRNGPWNMAGWTDEAQAQATEAEALLEQALAATPPIDPRGRLPGIYMARAMARRVCGRPKEAREDVRLAHSRLPSDPDIASAHALALRAEGNVDAAIDCLNAVNGKDKGAKCELLLAEMLVGRQAEPDRQQAAQIYLRRIAEIDPRGDEFAGELLFGAARLSQRPELAAAVADMLTKHGDALDKATVAATRAHLAIASGDAEAARKIVRAAEAGDEPWGTRELAMVAMRLEVWDRALALWKRILPSDKRCQDTMWMLRSARGAGDAGCVLDVCERLRLRGEETIESVELEVDTLITHREPTIAINVLNAAAAKFPKETELRFLAAVVRARMSPESPPCRDAIPEPESISTPERGGMAVWLLRDWRDNERAARYAYALWRRFPDNAFVSHALAQVIMSAETLALPQPTRVDSGVAVAVESDEQKVTWYVIEDGVAPNWDRHELSPDHMLSRAMRGLKQGDTFSYRSRLHQVVSIENPIVHRARECLATYDERFPERPEIRSFRVPETGKKAANVYEALGELGEELKRIDEARQRLEGLHQEKQIGVASVARWTGRTAVETMMHFIDDNRLVVHCAGGLEEEWKEATSKVERGGLVLDGTAVATLMALNAWHVLEHVIGPRVVPEAVLEELRDMQRRFREQGGSQLSLGIARGRVVAHRVSREEVLRGAGLFQQTIEKLKTHCEIAGGRVRLKLSSDKRSILEKIMPDSAADAIAIAADKGLSLWSDDLGTAAVAAEFGVARVWTQVVMRSLSARGAVPEESVRRWTERLFFARFAFTALTAAEIVDLLERRNWRIGDEGGDALSAYIGCHALGSHSNAMVFVAMLTKIWTQCRVRGTAKAIVRQFLGALPRRLGLRFARDLARGGRPRTVLSGNDWTQLTRVLRRWGTRARRTLHDRGDGVI